MVAVGQGLLFGQPPFWAPTAVLKSVLNGEIKPRAISACLPARNNPNLIHAGCLLWHEGNYSATPGTQDLPYCPTCPLVEIAGGGNYEIDFGASSTDSVVVHFGLRHP
jgi:hypothetical protein